MASVWHQLPGLPLQHFPSWNLFVGFRFHRVWRLTNTDSLFVDIPGAWCPARVPLPVASMTSLVATLAHGPHSQLRMFSLVTFLFCDPHLRVCVVFARSLCFKNGKLDLATASVTSHRGSKLPTSLCCVLYSLRCLIRYCLWCTVITLSSARKSREWSTYRSVLNNGNVRVMLDYGILENGRH